MSAWDLVTQSEQENIAKKNGYMLPGNEKKNLDIYGKKKKRKYGNLELLSEKQE